jgi:hypothetical protein
MTIKNTSTTPATATPQPSTPLFRIPKVSPEVFQAMTPATTITQTLNATRNASPASPSPAPLNTIPQVSPEVFQALTPATTITQALSVAPATAPALQLTPPSTPSAPPINVTHEKVGGVFNQDNYQPSDINKYGQALAIGAAHRTLLFPLESITTRMMLGESPKGGYFRGLGTCVATGAVNKAASLASNKAIRDTLENNEVPNASLAAGVGAGLVETAMNPVNVISQQAKMLPRNEVIPSLRAMPFKGFYNGGLALIGQNVIGAGIWYHGNTLVRDENDSLPVEAAKAAGVATASSAASWPAHLMHVQRIGVNGVSPSYKEIITQAAKQGFVQGLKLHAYFPAGLLRIVISGAVLGPLMNRFNEK